MFGAPRGVSGGGVPSGGVVVAREVACDTTAGLVEGFVFVQPHLAFFRFPEPAFDEGLGFGVAVAAASVADSLLGQARLEAAGGEGRAVVGAERRLALLDLMRGGRLFRERDRLPRRGSAPIDATRRPRGCSSR